MEEEQEIKPKKVYKKNYINNRDFCNALSTWKLTRESDATARLPDYVGECFMKLVENIGRKNNYRNYCVDEKTEALTQRGWLNIDQINEIDIIQSFNNGRLAWSSIKSIYRDDYDGKMFKMTMTGLDALVTPRHKFLTTRGLVRVEQLQNTDELILNENIKIKVQDINFHGGKSDSYNYQPNIPTIYYCARIWCPETEYGCFMARRNGIEYITGNTYLEEMKSEALITCVTYANKFNPTISENPFSYFTQCIENSFKGVLNTEKKISETKFNYIKNKLDITEGYDYRNVIMEGDE